MAQAETAAVAQDTTDDAFLGGLVRVRQPVRGYRAGVDAVLLAACVAPDADGSVLDAGAGAGTVGLCVAARCRNVSVTLIEREPALVELAHHNVVSNGLDARVSIVDADLADLPRDVTGLGLEAESFQQVLANPPYHDAASATMANDALKAKSHAMPVNAFEDWTRFLTRMVAPGGRVVMVHKADALPRILDRFNGRFGALRILPIHPRTGDPANRVLISGIKGSRAPLSLLSGLVLHGSGQAFTPEADAILRHGAALQF